MKKPTIQLFKDGDAMGIATDATDPEEFVNVMAECLGNLINDRTYEGDWEFQFRYWLPQIVEIACKLKGYKADVSEQRIICAGVTTTTRCVETYGPGFGAISMAPRVDEAKPLGEAQAAATTR